MKIILSDFDNTLVRNNQINYLVLQKIQEFREKNLFILATGRSKESLRILQDRLEFNSFDYAICSNGSCIVDTNYNIIFIKHFVNTEIESFFKKLQSRFSGNIIVAKTSGEDIANVSEHLKSDNNDVCGITLNIFDLSPRIVNLIKQHCNEYQWCYQKNGDYIKLSPKNTDKFSSFLELSQIKIFSCSMNNIYAIGDGLNDIEMLSQIPNSFTFVDSPLDVKAAAHFILDNYLDIFYRL